MEAWKERNNLYKRSLFIKYSNLKEHKSTLIGTPYINHVYSVAKLVRRNLKCISLRIPHSIQTLKKILHLSHGNLHDFPKHKNAWSCKFHLLNAIFQDNFMSSSSRGTRAWCSCCVVEFFIRSCITFKRSLGCVEVMNIEPCQTLNITVITLHDNKGPFLWGYNMKLHKRIKYYLKTLL